MLSLVGVDIALAASTRALQFSRAGDTAARLGQSVDVGTDGDQHGPAAVQGADPRRVGAQRQGTNRARTTVDIAPGDNSESLVTRLRPTRRGDQRAAVVTARSIGPLRLAGRQSSHRGAVAGAHPATVPVPQAPAVAAGDDCVRSTACYRC